MAAQCPERSDGKFREGDGHPQNPQYRVRQKPPAQESGDECPDHVYGTNQTSVALRPNQVEKEIGLKGQKKAKQYQDDSGNRSGHDVLLFKEREAVRVKK